MPVKERRTKILLLFFLIKDISFEYLSFTPILLKMFDLTLNQKTKGTLSSMLKDGSLEKKNNNEDSSNDDELPLYKLTDQGFYELCLHFPALRFVRDDWDGMWRIISYEIPEQKRHLRDRLRREMKGWGLGPWHRSFWITAHPIIGALRDLVYGKEEEQYIQAFESTHMFGDMEIFAEKVWGKSKIESQYKDLFRVWHSILSNEQSKEEKLKLIIYEYIKQLRNDPGLPMSIVGRRWIGNEAFSIFKEMRAILLS